MSLMSWCALRACTLSDTVSPAHAAFRRRTSSYPIVAAGAVSMSARGPRPARSASSCAVRSFSSKSRCFGRTAVSGAQTESAKRSGGSA
jgi:hypothetical protein